MPSEMIKSRRVFIATLKNRVFPELRSRGFVEMAQGREAGLIGNHHRLRPDNGYDLISFDLSETKHPRFHTIIGHVNATEAIQAITLDQVTAAHLPTRIYIQKKGTGVLAKILPRWFGHTMFGFEPREDPEFNKKASESACAEFISCLNQAELWWRTGELGQNLVEANFGGVSPSTSPQSGPP